MSRTRASVTQDAWVAAGRERYGDDQDAWRFRCPSCGHVAAVSDWRAAGAPMGAVAFSCVGRWDESVTAERAAANAFKGRGGPCNYAGGGLFGLNPVDVDGHDVFDFADRPLAGAA